MEGTQDSTIDKLAEFDIWSFFGDDMGIHDDLTRGNIDGLVVFFTISPTTWMEESNRP